jgi:hypothetical protein
VDAQLPRKRGGQNTASNGQLWPRLHPTGSVTARKYWQPSRGSDNQYAFQEVSTGIGLRYNILKRSNRQIGGNEFFCATCESSSGFFALNFDYTMVQGSIANTFSPIYNSGISFDPNTGNFTKDVNGNIEDTSPTIGIPGVGFLTFINLANGDRQLNTDNKPLRYIQLGFRRLLSFGDEEHFLINYPEINLLHMDFHTKLSFFGKATGMRNKLNSLSSTLSLLYIDQSVLHRQTRATFVLHYINKKSFGFDFGSELTMYSPRGLVSDQRLYTFFLTIKQKSVASQNRANAFDPNRRRFRNGLELTFSFQLADDSFNDIIVPRDHPGTVSFSLRYNLSPVCVRPPSLKKGWKSQQE